MLLKKIKSLVFPVKSVDTILRDFNKAITQLKQTEDHHTKQKEAKQRTMRLLEAQNVGHDITAERARNVRTKIEKLVG